MKKTIVSVFLAVSINSYAQHIKIKGTILDEKKQPIEFVNIALGNEKSETITGTTSNSNGTFELSGLKSGNYKLTISSVVYKTEELWLNGTNESRNLGNIQLVEDALSLEGVTVTASAQRSEVDRKIVYPSERQVKASSNGVELLLHMMLPRLQVDPMSNTIKIPGNGEVQTRINGVKVSIQEIHALRPEDIIRVEYHDNPGLRYGNAEIVLDYIVKRPETGGSFGIDLMQSPHIGWGNYQGYIKINHKKSEFSANYRNSPCDFYGSYRDNFEDFNLGNGFELHRYEKGIPSHWKLMQQWLNVAYNLQDNNKYQFNIALNYTSDKVPIARYKGILANKADETDYVDMLDETKSSIHNPSLDIYYQRNLKNEQALIFNVVGTYNKSFSDRLYTESKDGNKLTDIQNIVHGNKYSIIGEAIYEKKLAGDKRIGTGIRHSQSFSNNDYLNEHDYNTKMQQGSTYVYGELRGKLNKFDYILGIGGTRSFYRQEGSTDTYQYYTFNPKVTLKYAFTDRSYIRFRSSISNENPSLANLSAVEQIIDSLQIQRGNPYLESYLSYTEALDAEWSKGIFYAYMNFSYNYEPNAIMDEKFVEGNKVVQTWDNQKSWHRIAPMMQLRVGPIANILQFSVSGGLSHFISNGNNYNHRYSNWWLNGSATAMWKNFTLIYQIMTNQNWFVGETLTGGENVQKIMLGYRWKDLNIGAGMVNPFSDNYKVESGNWNKYASTKKLQYFKESSQMFFLTLSYNLSFGRSYSSGSKKLNNSDSDSGILRSGK